VNLSKRDKKILTIGILITAAIVIVMFVILPLIDYLNSLDEEKEAREARLIRMVETIKQKDYYQQALVRLKNNLNSYKAILINGKKVGDVQSELHRIVTTLAEKHSIGVRRIDASIKPERFNAEALKKDPLLANFIKVKVRASLRCTPDKMAQFLADLESNQKFLLIERLEIRAWNVRADKIISPEVVVTTFMYQPPSKAKKKKVA